MNFFNKMSNDKERKIEWKREVQTFENLEDKRSLFGKIKNIFDHFLKVLL